MNDTKKYSTIVVGMLLLLVRITLSAQTISLAGEWKFAIDRDDVGIKEKWYHKDLNERSSLPGSMAENNKGEDVALNTRWTASIYDSSFFFRPSLAKYRTPDSLKIPFWLTPAKYYVGKAWYQKDITVPADWNDKHLRIFFERVHIKSHLWIDGVLVGRHNSLSIPHVFDAGVLMPGKHRLTVMIDNSISDMNVGPDSHSVSDHTQGNWNGIIGKMYVEALPSLQLEDVQVFPDVKNKRALVKLRLVNTGREVGNARVVVKAGAYQQPAVLTSASTLIIVPAHDTIEGPLTLNFPTIQQWDEFTPHLYRLTVSLSSGKAVQSKEVVFGMREFDTAGTRFIINGKPTFLRGTLNNCEFPLTGYPAMDVGSWKKIFTTAKSFGLNHMRFHSWCPPEAAFVAADETGFYLQPEAPTWPNHGTSLGDGRFIDQYIYDETKRMVKAYGNHPSFCMLAAGNEPAGRNQVEYLTNFINYWKKKDNRRVYTGASVANSWPLVPANEFMIKAGTRGLNWLNAMPGSDSDFDSIVKKYDVPYVTHEMGQWCAFPNFDEIDDYTGAYKARNFELFREDLAAHGMASQAKDFLMASGKLQALCYKAEIEKDLRTKGLAGFQLLGLQDFPGQGTALVGVLNAFWKEKGYINANEFKRFCRATVPLLRLPKFVYGSNEEFAGEAVIFHYGPKDLKDATIEWTIKNDEGLVIKSGNLVRQTFARGGLYEAGSIRLSLINLPVPAHYSIALNVVGTDIKNDWDFWVYPGQYPEAKANDVYHCTTLDAKAVSILSSGGKVFLNAAGNIVKGNEITMYFTPVFWNTSWFKMRPPHVTGILVQSEHPAFKLFPTNYYSDYQWWSIVNKTQVMHLEDFPQGFTPLVQPIDTWFMNRKLGLLFEAKVGNGKLVVSSADLSNVSSELANRQLYSSVLNYMQSDAFNPKEELAIEVIRDLFISPSKEVWDSFTKDSPDELKPKLN